MADWAIGCDVGGTFTDFFARELTSGRSAVHKRPSTPDDPSRAVLEGLEELIALHGIKRSEISRFGHGTTVATNALLQRKGAKVAVVTTKGFRDLLEIGRQVRPLIYDLQVDAPAPLASRERRFEIEERIGPQGEIIAPLTNEKIEALIDRIRKAPDIEALAVCLIFSFLNPVHENRLAEALRVSFPDIPVSVSSEVQPEFREYERFSTALINAFLQPEVGRYMERLRLLVRGVAPNAEFSIFQSSGGLMSVDTASQLPVRTALSGPAAGAVGAAAAGARSSIGDIITLDIGGTSTDVCLIRKGKTTIATMRDIAGFRIRLPMVDIHTIGAGGGSIAKIGADGLMKVGPESAGAVPGPACYGRGGELPTVSDANVILGRLPAKLAGGGMRIDRDRAVTAVRPIADALGVTLIQAALGIIGIATSNMTRAIRAVSIEKGFDPRRFTLMPFGGAGGLHAADVARVLGMNRVIVPYAPGILCAEGLIVADLQEDFVQTCRCLVAPAMPEVSEAVRQLVGQARAWLEREGEPTEDLRLVLSFDMRYVGQNYELKVEISNSSSAPDAPDHETLRGAFLETYKRSYGHFDEKAPVEIINARLRVMAKLAQAASKLPAPNGEATPYDTVEAWFCETGSEATPMYDRMALPAGTRIDGPAIISQLDSTTVVPPWGRVIVDDALNMILEVGDD